MHTRQQRETCAVTAKSMRGKQRGAHVNVFVFGKVVRSLAPQVLGRCGRRSEAAGGRRGSTQRHWLKKRCQANLVNTSCFPALRASALRGGGTAMDPASARALVCVSKHPLGDAGEALKRAYLESHRAPSLLDTTPEEPETRCIERLGGNGRCRKRVSSVALTQYCWKHQRRSGICHPGDKALCCWNSNKLFQRPG